MLNQSNNILPAVFAETVCAYSFHNEEPYLFENYDIKYLHFHNVTEIGMCISGSGICCIEGNEQKYNAGDVQIIFPYMSHYHKSDVGNKNRWIWINIEHNELLSSIGIFDTSHIESQLQKGIAASGIINKSLFPKTASAIEKLVREFTETENNTWNVEKLAINFYSILIYLFEESASKPKLTYMGSGRISDISPALEEINHCLQNGLAISVENLARKCTYSVSNFRKIFHQVFHCSPQEYITACRIRAAKNMLRKTDKKITEIAFEIGYNNISGFNRAFFKVTNMSPSEYRNKILIK